MHRSKQSWLIEHLQILLMLVGNPAAAGAWQRLPWECADSSSSPPPPPQQKGLLLSLLPEQALWTGLKGLNVKQDVVVRLALASLIRD